MSATILLSLVLGFAAHGSDQRVIDRTVDARSVNELRATLPFGSLHISADGGDKIIVHYVRRVTGGSADERRRILDEASLRIEDGGGNLRVEEVLPRNRFDGDHNGFSLNVSLEIHAPARTALELKTGAGDVEVVRMGGRINALTGAGSIIARGLAADERSVDLETGAGDVNLNGRVGDLSARSGAGKIRLNGVDCTGRIASLHSGAGNIDARLHAAPSDRLEVESGVGHIALSLSGGLHAHVQSHSDRRAPGAVGEYVAGVIGEGTHFRLSSGVGSVTLSGAR